MLMPVAITLDVKMPNMDGWQVLSALKADSTVSAIPVVVVSADATPRQAERLLALGATAYLTKPVDVAQLLAVVDRATVGAVDVDRG